MIYTCTYPKCNCGHADGPPCEADHASLVEELQRQVGAEMINITTTVWYTDEWLAIPGIWQSVANERDRLKAEVDTLRAELDTARGNWK